MNENDELSTEMKGNISAISPLDTSEQLNRRKTKKEVMLSQNIDVDKVSTLFLFFH